jgi:hypothetical protein
MAVVANYGNLRAKPGGYHYALTSNWDIEIANVPEPLMPFVKLFGGKEGVINTSCTQVSNLPDSNLNEGILSGNVRGIPFHQPGGRESSIKEINLSLLETYDYRNLRFFESWKGMAVNRFDFSQNLAAMIPSGVSITLTDSDRINVMMTYNLYDVVCTKCNLGGELASEPDIAKVQVSLKFGTYSITRGEASPSDPLIEGVYDYDHL